MQRKCKENTYMCIVYLYKYLKKFIKSACLLHTKVLNLLSTDFNTLDRGGMKHEK